MGDTSLDIPNQRIPQLPETSGSIIVPRIDVPEPDGALSGTAPVPAWQPIRLGFARRSPEKSEGVYSRRYQVVLLVAAVAISVSAAGLAYVIGGQSAIKTLGYPGVFLASLISAASLFIPLPISSAGVAVGAQLDPPFHIPPFVMIGLAGGVGSALGEFTGFLAGRAGHCTISDSRAGKAVDRLMKRWGGIAVFSVAAVPNPFVDVMGIAAGAGGMSARRFFGVICPAKVINHTITAFVMIEGATLALSVV